MPRKDYEEQKRVQNMRTWLKLLKKSQGPKRDELIKKLSSLSKEELLSLIPFNILESVSTHYDVWQEERRRLYDRLSL